MRKGWIDPCERLPEPDIMVGIMIQSKVDKDYVTPVFGKLIDGKWHQIANFGEWKPLKDDEIVEYWESIPYTVNEDSTITYSLMEPE